MGYSTLDRLTLTLYIASLYFSEVFESRSLLRIGNLARQIANG
jgi:hypothetical protein